MKNWTLRTRLTLWSAIFFAAAVAFLGIFTLSLVRKHQIASLDAELISETRTFFHELYEHGPAGVMHAVTEVDRDTRAVVLGTDGAALWISPELEQESFAQAPVGVHTIGAWRVSTTMENGYTVRMARSFGSVEATVADVRRAYLIALPLLLVFVAGGAWWLVRSALRPVQAIGETARRITTEHLEERLPIPVRHDELGQLADTLNAMLERLDRGFRQAVRFTADASHELKTPLSLIAAGLEELRRRRDLPPEVLSALGSLLEDNRRLTAVCQDLLLLARADAGRITIARQPHDLRALIEAAVEDGRILGADSGITFALDLPSHAEESVDARYFTQILLNLLSNAVKYNRPGGTVRVALSAHEAVWELGVINTGPGLAPEHQAKLFERFFRADKSASTPGHGLGLSLSRELARAHGGDLTFVASTSERTTFRLTLPHTRFEPETRTAAPAPARADAALLPS